MKKHIIFYQAHESFVKYVLKNGGTKEDAHDAYHEALYWAVRAMNNGVEIEDWGDYMFIAAKNAYVKMKQKKDRLPQEGLEEKATVLQLRADPNYRADISLNLQIIEDCINRLSQRFKDVLISTMEGYSDKEIEARYQLAANSAKVIRSHARKELKRLLGEAGFALTALFITIITFLK